MLIDSFVESFLRHSVEMFKKNSNAVVARAVIEALIDVGIVNVPGVDTSGLDKAIADELAHQPASILKE